MCRRWKAVFELLWQWRAATEAENKRYKNKSASRNKDEGQEDISLETKSDAPATEGARLQERVLNAWLSGDDSTSAKRPKGLNPELLASNARRFVRKNTSDFFAHPQLGEFLRGELDVYLKHEFVQVWEAVDSELPRIRAKFNLVRQIALDLITFLDQIERFQATLRALHGAGRATGGVCGPKRHRQKPGRGAGADVFGTVCRRCVFGP